MEEYLLSIDQGTTGTKVILVGKDGEIHASGYRKHTQYYPNSGWVEHDPVEIWECIQLAVKDALETGEVGPEQIRAVGLANQGETVLFWDAMGNPLYPAIVWSCRRSQPIAERWEADGDWAVKVREKTGLKIDPYFSATKIRWMMDEVKAVSASCPKNVRCSTMDSWIIWKMTGGGLYATDPSTAARTLLYNITSLDWDSEILEYLGIRREWLPRVMPTAGQFGMTSPEAFCGIHAPIVVSIVDQPAALYGHLCTEPGDSKCTYGTGCFVYMNMGQELPALSDSSLLKSIVWSRGNRITYALDGAVYSAGSAIEWASGGLSLFKSVAELQEWSQNWFEGARSEHSALPDIKTRLWFVPTLNGIGAPYWNSDLRGIFLGLSHNTSKQDMAKAVLEGIAHRVADVLESMRAIGPHSIRKLLTDGGLTNNPYLMQYQADILGIPVEVSGVEETTALGVAYLAGETCGWWTVADLKDRKVFPRTYYPSLSSTARESLRMGWRKLTKAAMQFYQ